jgi:hypothetical protein
VPLAEKQEEWVYPYGQQYMPRLFMVYPGGDAVEVLDKTAFRTYAEQRLADPKCTVTKSLVHGEEDAAHGVHAHTFLTELTHRSIGAVMPLPLESVIKPRPASGTRAMPALRVPSKSQRPPQPAPLTLPRIVAVPPQLMPPREAKALVCRQVKGNILCVWPIQGRILGIHSAIGQLLGIYSASGQYKSSYSEYTLRLANTRADTGNILCVWPIQGQLLGIYSASGQYKSSYWEYTL